MIISVALCTYNGSLYLREQLDSLLNQTTAPDEIVISDDCSNDQTIEIINEYLEKYPKIFRVFINDEKKGVFKNFPFVISQCIGDIIFTCDQDDYWFPNKIENHVSIYNDNKHIELVFSNADVVLNDINNYLYPLWESNMINDYENGQPSIKSLLYKGKSIAGCCMSFRKDLFNRILPFPDGVYHDDWLATNACLNNGIIGINKSLIKYRQHNSNAVGIIRGSKLSFYKSLITNVKFYVNSDIYIYHRHSKVYSALIQVTSNKGIISKLELESNLEFYKIRSSYNILKWIQVFKLLTHNLILNRYKYHNGIYTYFKDLYNLTFIKFFKVYLDK